jgi:hypothetical protein
VPVCYQHPDLLLPPPALIAPSNTCSRNHQRNKSPPLSLPPLLLPCIVHRPITSLVIVIRSSPLVVPSAILIAIVDFVVGWRGRQHCRVCCLGPSSVGWGKISPIVVVVLVPTTTPCVVHPPLLSRCPPPAPHAKTLPPPSSPRPCLPPRPHSPFFTPTTQWHTCRSLHHPSPPLTPHCRPTNTTACPLPSSCPNNAAMRVLRCRYPTNAAAHPPLPKLIVVFAHLLPSCHCHQLGCRPTDTAAHLPPPSHPKNAAMRALRRCCLANGATCPPLPKLIVFYARLPLSCCCHQIVIAGILSASYKYTNNLSYQLYFSHSVTLFLKAGV